MKSNYFFDFCSQYTPIGKFFLKSNRGAMYRTIFLILVATSSFHHKIMAQKDSATVGVFITNLDDFDLADGSFVAEFRTWTLFKNDILSFKESQEITKSKKTSFTNFYAQKKGGLN